MCDLIPHLQHVHGLVQGVVLLVEAQQKGHDPERQRHGGLKQQATTS